jgi:anti-sigma B factor antagonist
MENMDMEKPSIKVSYKDEAVVALLLAEEILDEASINRLSEALMAEAKANAPAKMIVNFSRVKRLSSASLGAFIRLNANIENAGGKLALCRLIPVLQQLFLITKLDKIFSICPDEDAALKALSK